MKYKVWKRTSQGFPEWVGEVRIESLGMYVTKRYTSRFFLLAALKVRVSVLLEYPQT